MEENEEKKITSDEEEFKEPLGWKINRENKYY